VRPTFAAVVLFLFAWSADRATDEIQVYNAEINEPGRFSLQLHGNEVLRGRTSAGFPGGLVPDGAFNGTPELGYGLSDSWEVGAYLPYAVTRDGEIEWGGAKLRALVVSPRARERRFFYGANLELSYQPRLFEENHWNSEIRAILGWRVRSIEFIVNPIVDVALGGRHRTADLSPAARLAYILSPLWTVGLEHYSGFGPIDHLDPSRRQLQETFAVADFSGRTIDVDVGVGRGLTPGSDAWTVKLILGWTL